MTEREFDIRDLLRKVTICHRVSIASAIPYTSMASYISVNVDYDPEIKFSILLNSQMSSELHTIKFKTVIVINMLL